MPAVSVARDRYFIPIFTKLNSSLLQIEVQPSSAGTGGATSSLKMSALEAFANNPQRVAEARAGMHNAANS